MIVVVVPHHVTIMTWPPTPDPVTGTDPGAWHLQVLVGRSSHKHFYEQLLLILCGRGQRWRGRLSDTRLYLRITELPGTLGTCECALRSIDHFPKAFWSPRWNRSILREFTAAVDFTCRTVNTHTGHLIMVLYMLERQRDGGDGGVGRVMHEQVLTYCLLLNNTANE